MKKYYKINWKNNLGIIISTIIYSHLFMSFGLTIMRLDYLVCLLFSSIIIIMIPLVKKYDLSLYDCYFEKDETLLDD